MSAIEDLVSLDATAAESQLVMCITGDSEGEQFDLGDISAGPSPSEVAQQAREHGRALVGIVALRDGAVVSRLLTPLDEATVYTLSSACMSYIFGRMQAALAGMGLPQLTPSSDAKPEVHH